jgi:hypothetical protein
MPSDVLFKSGKGAYLQLYNGTADINIPATAVTYTMGDNDAVVNMAQGGTKAAPVNLLTGLYTPSLEVTANPFSGWFTAAILQAMFGASTSDITTRSDANGDITKTYRSKFFNGMDTNLDTLKIASLSVAGTGASNQLTATLGFLGIGDTTAYPGSTYSASTGAPLYWKNVTAATWKPEGGSATDIAPALEGFQFTISTGASYAKFADGTDYPSRIDVASTLGCSVSLDQRAGAVTRVLSSRNGTLALTIGGVVFSFGLNRQGRRYATNLNGGIVDRLTYQLYTVDGTGISIT